MWLLKSIRKTCELRRRYNIAISKEGYNVKVLTFQKRSLDVEDRNGHCARLSQLLGPQILSIENGEICVIRQTVTSATSTQNNSLSAGRQPEHDPRTPQFMVIFYFVGFHIRWKDVCANRDRGRAIHGGYRVSGHG